MINLALPRAYNSCTINHFFKNLTYLNGEFFKIPINIAFAHGSFPYMYWNGRYNNNSGNGMFYQELADLSSSNKFHLAFAFNCDNIFIEPNDYEDTYANTILTLFENGANLLEVHNMNFMEYLHNKYPYYYFIISEHYFLTNQSYDLLKQDYIKYFHCSAQNTELLAQIENKNKALISINYHCFNCKNYAECDLNAQLAQYSYSEKCPTQDCKIFNNNRLKSLSLEQILELKKMGFTNFVIEDNFSDNNEYFTFLLQFLIKPEYQPQVMYMWNGGKDK